MFSKILNNIAMQLRGNRQYPNKHNTWKIDLN